MKSRADHAKRSWRRSVWFLRIFPFWIALIVGINVWNDHATGKPFDWANILYGLGFVAFTGFLAIWMWLIYKFILRYAEYRDRQLP